MKIWNKLKFHKRNESKVDTLIYKSLKRKSEQLESPIILSQIVQLYESPNLDLTLSQCLYIAILYLTTPSYGGPSHE